MNRWQDISISDASLKAEFITKFFNGDYIDAFTIISNNPQLNTKAFVADTINQIATILLSLENNFQNGVIDYLSQQYSNFQNIIDNYNLKGNWNASTTYQIYNFVTYNNIDYLYINLTPSSGNLPTNTDYWVEINIQGEKGAPGLGVNLQYNWNATTPYNALDVVYYNNALWVARVANINKVPGSTEEWETLTGPIVSFYNDGDIDISNLSVAVEPVQDLHGYDNPWPAGGGKNVMHPATNVTASEGITASNDNGKITINGQATSGKSVYIYFEPMTIQTGYIMAFMNSFVNATFYFLNGGTQVDYFYASYVNRVVNAQSLASLYGKTFNTLRIMFSGDVTLSNANFSPMVVLDGADTTQWSPYSNLCPISGWNSVELEADGENLVDEEAIFGTLQGWTSSDGVYTGEPRFIHAAYGNGIPSLKFKPTTQYTVSVKYLGTISGIGLALRYIYTDGTSDVVYCNSTTLTDYQLTSSANKTIEKLILSYGSNFVISLSNFQLVEGSTPTEYKPYAGNRYVIQLGQTVYGGTLTIAEDGSVNALVDRAMVDLGTLDWATYSSPNNHVFRTTYPTPRPYIDDNALPPHAICSSYYPMPYGPVSANDDGAFSYGNGRLIVIDHRFTDVADFGSAVNGVQLCYELAAPITIDLDPVTISTISGQTNNVWADAGDVSVELSKKYWEEFIKFKLASIYTDYIEPSGDSLYNGLIWFEVFNPQNWSYLTNRNYTWNQINTNNDTWESVDRGDY